jgi:hypothetical protein
MAATTDTAEPLVTVRRRWNDPYSAIAPLSALREVVIRNDPGGICAALPRPFPFARVWCEALIGGTSIHPCDPATAPHELQLCILEADNSSQVNARIREKLRR